MQAMVKTQRKCTLFVVKGSKQNIESLYIRDGVFILFAKMKSEFGMLLTDLRLSLWPVSQVSDYAKTIKVSKLQTRKITSLNLVMKSMLKMMLTNIVFTNNVFTKNDFTIFFRNCNAHNFSNGDVIDVDQWMDAWWNCKNQTIYLLKRYIHTHILLLAQCNW